ncbi:MAG: hypothetical protein KDB58_10895 [Solirubrobacterales bacterium]|nr:hypothetical protein [Solirubrobacterales bacterium]MCB8969336.1 hypothetical protein [Thermoleophilales bacterium]MCO5327798.1 hypothetical protein [Solirubrobacterales bacterium]
MGERLTSARRRALAVFATALLLPGFVLGLAACGNDAASQDENEPEGDFPVEVTTAKFPTEQRLAQTSDLVLGVKNTGDETIPMLAFTIETNDGGADGSFAIRLDDDSLANPNRPVWILENKFPRPQGTPPPPGLGPGFRAQTNTWGFDSLDPGETENIVWRVTPVQPGTYTLHYLVEAGLDGNAKAVTEDGGQVKGEFVVTITDKPPKATVNGNGEVVTK